MPLPNRVKEIMKILEDKTKPVLSKAKAVKLLDELGYYIVILGKEFFLISDALPCITKKIIGINIIVSVYGNTQLYVTWNQNCYEQIPIIRIGSIVKIEKELLQENRRLPNKDIPYIRLSATSKTALGLALTKREIYDNLASYASKNHLNDYYFDDKIYNNLGESNAQST